MQQVEDASTKLKTAEEERSKVHFPCSRVSSTHCADSWPASLLHPRNLQQKTLRLRVLPPNNRLRAQNHNRKFHFEIFSAQEVIQQSDSLKTQAQEAQNKLEQQQTELESLKQQQAVMRQAGCSHTTDLCLWTGAHR